MYMISVTFVMVELRVSLSAYSHSLEVKNVSCQSPFRLRSAIDDFPGFRSGKPFPANCSPGQQVRYAAAILAPDCPCVDAGRLDQSHPRPKRWFEVKPTGAGYLCP